MIGQSLASRARLACSRVACTAKAQMMSRLLQLDAVNSSRDPKQAMTGMASRYSFESIKHIESEGIFAKAYGTLYF